MIRISIADKYYYPSDFQELEEKISNCFENGPGSTPLKDRSKKIYGILVPHSSYDDSGECAAWAYKELGEGKFPDAYIILGINHKEYIGRKVALSKKDWKTPFGIVKNCSSSLKTSLKEDEKPHITEHSIEVQLPFLQFISKQYLRDLKIIPINISHITKEEAENYAKEFENVSVIISSNMVKGNSKDTREKNIEIIKSITELNTERFLELTKETPICGKYAIVLGIELLKKLGSTKGSLMKYISKDNENYASIVFN